MRADKTSFIVRSDNGERALQTGWNPPGFLIGDSLKRRRQMKIRENYTCPLELTHDITKGKWKPIILWQLGKGPRSLSSLEGEINGINQKMLLEQLKELCDYGFVSKKNFDGYPLKVEYSLTERGRKILDAIIIMQGVGVEIMKENDMEDVLREGGFID
jgi:DNA-binding HxlR family transcriptional regulator